MGVPPDEVEMSGTNWGPRWQGGRTYGENGKTFYVIEKMRHGRRYTTPLDVGSEREALAELALFERDPEGYTTRRLDAIRRAAQAVYIEPANVQRFLES
jgi:transposase-like protein